MNNRIYTFRQRVAWQPRWKPARNRAGRKRNRARFAAIRERQQGRAAAAATYAETIQRMVDDITELEDARFLAQIEQMIYDGERLG